jgi:hypothetical protein
MLYTLIEPFSPNDGARWTNYCAWRGLEFERFDSVDGALRPSLFLEPTGEDWSHIVNESFMLHYFVDRQYAELKRREIGRGDLVGLEFHAHDESATGFLGYDLIDCYNDISLLTNWGNDVGIVNRSISGTGLIRERALIEEVKSELLLSYGADSHVQGCKIVSIYGNPAEPRC